MAARNNVCNIAIKSVQSVAVGPGTDSACQHKVDWKSVGELKEELSGKKKKYVKKIRCVVRDYLMILKECEENLLPMSVKCNALWEQLVKEQTERKIVEQDLQYVIDSVELATEDKLRAVASASEEEHANRKAEWTAYALQAEMGIRSLESQVLSKIYEADLRHAVHLMFTKHLIRLHAIYSDMTIVMDSPHNEASLQRQLGEILELLRELLPAYQRLSETKLTPCGSSLDPNEIKAGMPLPKKISLALPDRQPAATATAAIFLAAMFADSSGVGLCNMSALVVFLSLMWLLQASVFTPDLLRGGNEN